MAKTEHEAKDIINLLWNILLGGGLALAICCALLFCAAAAISMGWLTEESTQLTVASCAAGTACGSFWAIRRCGSRVLVVGLLVSAVFFLLLLTVGVLVYRDVSLGEDTLAVFCGGICGGVATGLLCARPKKKKRK